jgi:hypothetical protein
LRVSVKHQPTLPHPLLWALCIALAVGILAPTMVTAAKDDNARPQPTAASSGIENMPRLGLEAYSFGSEQGMQSVVASGAKLIRVELSWAAIEPLNVEPSLYNWTRYDSALSRLKENGLAPLVVVKDCPLWACVRDNGPLLENMEADFAQFMGALAARYSQPAYGTHYWELFNEPDGAGGPGNLWGWGMHGDKYALMLSHVYPAVKAADPQSVVLLGGLAYDFFLVQGGPFNPDFLPDVLDNGGADYVDGVAFHYYRGNANGWARIGDKVDEIRSLMSQHGADNLPLLCTEAGMSSDPQFNGSEAAQARYLVQMNVLGAVSGLRAQVWFLDRDFTSPDPWMQVFTRFGLARVDGSHKPSHTAMNVFASEIGSGAYMEQLRAEDGLTSSFEGYRFVMANGTREVSVVWNNVGTDTLTIPADQALDMVRVVSIDGQTLATSPGPDGTRLLEVGLDPVYVEWGIRFTDVQSYSWEYPYVEYLASNGIISGYQDGTFRPGNPATRGQFAKMIVLGMGWPINPHPTPHFADVQTDHTFYQYIETAFEHGIIGGYPCGAESEPCPGTYFRPGNDITRGQIAKIVVLSKGWQLQDPQLATFSDVPRDSTFYTYIETAVAHGIVSGYQDATFRPGNNATRAQLSKMLALSLQQP